jgi:hypothetical protein
MLGLLVAGGSPDGTADAPGQAPEEPRALKEPGAPDLVQVEVGAGGSEEKVNGGAGVSENKGQEGAGAEKEGGDELSRDVAAQRAEELSLQSAPMQTFNDGTPRIYTSAPEAKYAAKFDL